ncbi:ATP-binding protein [Neolewinella sp.]|uniref:ATP-binding protein n=1 Tax=Neolewinella sp. TaxID=2993543 RepID=UPI003B51580A
MSKTHRIKVYDGPKSYGGKFLTDGMTDFAPGKYEILVIDFSDCRFLEPIQLVGLASLIELYAQSGVLIRFEGVRHLEVAEYLENIRFFDYWQADFNREAYTKTQIGTNLGLWKISQPMIDAYTTSAQRFYQENYFETFDLSPLAIALMELFNNIFDHSESPVTGYTMSQYYPHKHKLKVAVCDLGVGICNKVNTFKAAQSKPALPDHQALELAFQKSFSTKSTLRNRGFGLDTIRSICSASDGRIFVASNAGVLKYQGNQLQSYSVNNSFPGTHFEFVLDTRKFDEAEEDSNSDIISLDELF